jgi:hypothetical protein
MASTVTEEQARAYADVGDDVDLTDYLATAEDLIDGYLSDTVVPDSVRANAVLQLVQELYMRKRSPGGITSYAGADTAVRLSRDPMVSIYALFRPWTAGRP